MCTVRRRVPPTTANCHGPKLQIKNFRSSEVLNVSIFGGWLAFHEDRTATTNRRSRPSRWRRTLSGNRTLFCVPTVNIIEILYKRSKCCHHFICSINRIYTAWLFIPFFVRYIFSYFYILFCAFYIFITIKLYWYDVILHNGNLNFN